MLPQAIDLGEQILQAEAELELAFREETITTTFWDRSSQEMALPALREERRRMVGSGDRSEKIRTYNFPQNRVTDHRIHLTLHQLPSVMEGELDSVIDPVVAHFQAERMEQEALATTH